MTQRVVTWTILPILAGSASHPRAIDAAILTRVEPRDLAFCSLLIPGLMASLVPIALGRLRERSSGRSRHGSMIVAWLWFFAGALGGAAGLIGLARAFVLAVQRSAELTPEAELGLALLWPSSVICTAWLATRVVFGSAQPAPRAS